MINYRRISYIHIFYNCNFGIDGEEKHETRTRGIYLPFPSFHILPPLPHFTKNFHHDFSFASCVPACGGIPPKKRRGAFSSAALSTVPSLA